MSSIGESAVSNKRYSLWPFLRERFLNITDPMTVFVTGGAGFIGSHVGDAKVAFAFEVLRQDKRRISIFCVDGSRHSRREAGV